MPGLEPHTVKLPPYGKGPPETPISAGFLICRSARPSLYLLNAIGVHPEPGAPAAAVAAAGRDRIRPFIADVLVLEEVQRFSTLHTSEPEALQMEHVEEGEAVIHVFKGVV